MEIVSGRFFFWIVAKKPGLTRGFSRVNAMSPDSRLLPSTDVSINVDLKYRTYKDTTHGFFPRVVGVRVVGFMVVFRGFGFCGETRSFFWGESYSIHVIFAYMDGGFLCDQYSLLSGSNGQGVCPFFVRQFFCFKNPKEPLGMYHSILSMMGYNIAREDSLFVFDF